MHEGGSPSTYSLNLLVGSKHFFMSMLSFVTPLWVPLVFAWRARKPGSPRFELVDVRFFFWLYTAGLGFIAALVLTGELVHIQSRWLQPLLFSFPIGFFVFFPPHSDLVYRRLLLTIGIFAIVLVTGLALRPQMQAATGRHPRIFQPYAQLATDVRQRFPGVDAFAVQDRFVGGNIRLQFPHVPVVLLDEACGRQGRVLMLSGDGIDELPRKPLPACPGMRVVGRGQLRIPSVAQPGERLAFDYLWVQLRN
jgi:hypothetical protein